MRTALVVAGVALGVAAWTTTRVLERSVDRALHAAATPLHGMADLYVSNGDSGIPRRLLETVAKVHGVRDVQPLVVQRVLLRGPSPGAALLLGADLQKAAARGRSNTIRVSPGTPQAYLTARLLGQTPVILGRALADRHPKKNATLDVLVNGKLQTLRPVGTVEAEGAVAALGGNVLLLDDRLAARLVGRPELLSRLDVVIDRDADPQDVRRAIEQAVAGRARVRSSQGDERSSQEILAGLRVGFSLCGMGALALGLFLVYNVLSVSLAERSREIALLRSIGASLGQVRVLLVGEAVILGLLGSILGVPLGWILAVGALGPLHRALSDVFLPLHAQQAEIDIYIIAGSVAASLVTVLAATLVPILKASRSSLVEGIKRESAAGRVAVLVLVSAAGSVLVVLGLALHAFKESLPERLGTFGTLVFVLGGVLCLVPLIVQGLSRLARTAIGAVFGVSGRLAADHIMRNPSRAGLTIGAVAAGVALVFQTSGVIHGNESAVREWVDQGIAGDLFVTSGGPLSASGQLLPMDTELGARLKASIAGSHSVPMSFRYVDLERNNRPARVLLLALDAREYVAANVGRNPPLPDLDAYRQLIAPATVLVSENFAALNRVNRGDTLEVPGAAGPVRLRIVGIITDFSCREGTIVVNRAGHEQDFSIGNVDVYDLYLPAGSQVERVRRDLRTAPWVAERAIWILTRDEMRGHILGMIRRLYGIAYIQEAVAGAVAALGVMTTLLISVLQRRREIALLRALGATRSQLLSVVLVEAVLMGLLGAVLGLTIGLPLEWYVLRVVLFEETGFVFAVLVPWSIAAVLALGVIGISALAGLGPGLRATNSNLAAAIAFE